jgi:hypothetical protein
MSNSDKIFHASKRNVRLANNYITLIREIVEEWGELSYAAAHLISI